MTRPTVPLATRYWAKVDVSATDECWPWRGAKQSKGYGHMSRGRDGEGNVLAHHVAWELEHGERVPLGLTVDHLCNVRTCCNPTHLEIVERWVNTRRRWIRREATEVLAARDAALVAEFEHMRELGLSL